jgi:hypothetical protein
MISNKKLDFNNKYINNLKKEVDLNDDDFEFVKNINIKADLNYDNKNKFKKDESYYCKFYLSYDFVKDMNKIINVEIDIYYFLERDYEISDFPKIKHTNNLKVINKSDDFYPLVNHEYDSINDTSISINENQNDEYDHKYDTWSKLMNTILKYIDGNPENWWDLTKELDTWDCFTIN